MPSRRMLCWCLGSKAPPKISYEIENGHMTLKPVEVALPMPEDESEINDRFTELVSELGLDKSHQEAMYGLPPEKKWQIYCSKKKDHLEPNFTSSPAYYISKLNSMTNTIFTPSADGKCPDGLRGASDPLTSRLKVVDSLRTALRTQPLSFVIRFVEMGGLQSLLNLLLLRDRVSLGLHSSTIGCIKALMNCPEGRMHLLSHPDGVKIITQSLRSSSVRTKTTVCEILGALCMVPGGHKKVLQGMLHFQKFANERTRFQTLINDLDRECADDAEDGMEEISFKTAILSLINASLKYGASQTHLEFRLHLRYEFLMLGILPVIEKLKKIGNSILDRHLDFFEMVRNEDEWQFAKKFETNHVDTKSASAMLDLMKKRMSHTSAHQSLLSILLHLLEISAPSPQRHLHQWQLIDRIVQQIVLQNKDGDPDCSPLDIDVKKLAKKLANESALQEVNQKIKEVQKDNDELSSKLSKKERECIVKVEEKEELMQTLNKMKAKLEKDAANHLEQLADLNQRLVELQRLLEHERNERLQLELAVKNGSLPDDAKVGLSRLSSSSSSAIGQGLANRNSQLFLPVLPPPPPLPPPMNIVAPPPPPPNMLQRSKGVGGVPNGYCNVPGPMATKRRNIPEPGQALKSFNWTKLPDNKVEGTIWMGIDESKIYKCLDLEDFERNFSAYQRQESIDPDLLLQGGGTGKLTLTRVRELSVIDGRRAQNCTILLSKLKMSNQELADSILNVDSREDLPKDMCEQLLKFVPSIEEIQMLDEHSHEIESMAKADRFLFEMSRIDHYEQRLNALHYKKRFNERVLDSRSRIEAVLEASREVAASRRLKSLLELVLALGNYMNRGQRGNAPGFRVASLNKIGDTKSSVNKKVTLLHYLGDVVEQKFPDLCAIEDDIKKVRDGAKVNLTELAEDLKLLKTGLGEIEKEIDYHKNKSMPAGSTERDKFVPVMTDFTSVAAYNLSELEDQFAEMSKTFENVLSLFGEEAKKSQPEEFFGIFDSFVTTFVEARCDNERFRKQKEEEDRRIKMEAQLKAEKEAKDRARRAKNIEEGKGEFDDLISALQTGEVFGDDIARLKRTKRNKTTINNNIHNNQAKVRKRDDTSRERAAPILVVP